MNWKSQLRANWKTRRPKKRVKVIVQDNEVGELAAILTLMEWQEHAAEALGLDFDLKEGQPNIWNHVLAEHREEIESEPELIAVFNQIAVDEGLDPLIPEPKLKAT